MKSDDGAFPFLLKRRLFGSSCMTSTPVRVNGVDGGMPQQQRQRRCATKRSGGKVHPNRITIKRVRERSNILVRRIIPSGFLWSRRRKPKPLLATSTSTSTPPHVKLSAKKTLPPPTTSHQSYERNPSRSRGALEDRVKQGKICVQGGGGKRNNSSVRGIANHHCHKKGLRDPYFVRGLKGLRDPYSVRGLKKVDILCVEDFKSQKRDR